MSTQKTQSSGKIAVAGERELVIGYRLLGIEDTFVVSGEEASKTIQDLYHSGKFSLIIASDSLRNTLPAIFRKKNRGINRAAGSVHASTGRKHSRRVNCGTGKESVRNKYPYKLMIVNG